MKVSEVQSVPVSRIFEYEDNRPIDKAHLESLIATTTARDVADFEPIYLIDEGVDGFGVVDGQHRVRTAKAHKVTHIRVRLVEYESEAEMLAHRFELNLRHGLKPNKQQQKDHALWLIENFPQMSSREIGAKTGLDHKTVQRLKDGNSPEGRERAEASSVRRLCRTAASFYSDESAFLSPADSARSKNRRRKLIISECQRDAKLIEALSAVGQEMLDAAKDAVKALGTNKRKSAA